MQRNLRPNWALLAALLFLAGCQAAAPPADTALEKAITEAISQLEEPDRLLASSQGFCAVQTQERLGSMGVPLKLEIEGQPVFLCCKGCQRKALADPKATLARVEQLKRH
jgi:hypothetical protein